MKRFNLKEKLKKKAGIIAVIIFIILTIPISAACYYIFIDIPNLNEENPENTSFQEYREKEWYREGKDIKKNQVWVPIEQISPYLVNAVLIAEDDRFYDHNGFDFEAMEKALEKNIKYKKYKYGGSTITQQLAKNLYLSPAKNPVRKIFEAFLTWRLEKSLPKKRILEIYLNVVEWGENGIFGIEAASQFYYKKPAVRLGPDEASRLASVLPNPRRFKPNGRSKYIEKRSHKIYEILMKRGIVRG